MSKPRPNEKVNYIGSHAFTLDRRFSDFRLIGQGSYGVVCSAFDSLLHKKIAIKKISPVAKQIDDAKHVLREIRLMRYLGRHENIITLEDLIIRESADELYIVMELLDSDLHRVLQSKQPLSNNHLKYFFFQLICGVKFLHDHHIIHRDLKPGNLLVTRDCKLRITDFGLAREKAVSDMEASGQGEHGPIAMTEHVITRWYRPPELMLLPDGMYTYAVDMWSAGCILGEMLGRMPLFPGKNFIHQLTLIFDVIGSPLSSEVRHIQNPQACKYLETQMKKTRVSFSQLYPMADREAIDVMETLLVFTPEKRATANEVLYSSSYLASLVSNPKTQSTVFPEITEKEFEFGFERQSKITRLQLKSMIQGEVNTFHLEKFGGKEKPRSSSRGREGPNPPIPTQPHPQHQKQPPITTHDRRPMLHQQPGNPPIPPSHAHNQPQPHSQPQSNMYAHAQPIAQPMRKPQPQHHHFQPHPHFQPRPPPATYQQYQHLIEECKEEMPDLISDQHHHDELEDDAWLASIYAKAHHQPHSATANILVGSNISAPMITSQIMPGSILKPDLMPVDSSASASAASTAGRAIDRVTEQFQQQLQLSAQSTSSSSAQSSTSTQSATYDSIQSHMSMKKSIGSPVRSTSSARSNSPTHHMMISADTSAAPPSGMIRKSIIVANNIPPSKATMPYDQACTPQRAVDDHDDVDDPAILSSYHHISSSSPSPPSSLATTKVAVPSRMPMISASNEQEEVQYKDSRSTSSYMHHHLHHNVDSNADMKSATRYNYDYKHHMKKDEKSNSDEQLTSYHHRNDQLTKSNSYIDRIGNSNHQNGNGRNQHADVADDVDEEGVDVDVEDERDMKYYYDYNARTPSTSQVNINATPTSSSNYHQQNQHHHQHHQQHQQQLQQSPNQQQDPEQHRIMMLKKKKLTVARSPRFSKMSWERKAEAQARPQHHHHPHPQHQPSSSSSSSSTLSSSGVKPSIHPPHLQRRTYDGRPSATMRHDDDVDTIYSGTTVSGNHSIKAKSSNGRFDSRSNTRSSSAPRPWKQL